MKYLVGALAIAVAMAIAIYTAASFVVSDPDTALGIAALPFVGCVHYAEMLEQRHVRMSLWPDRPTAVPTLHGYVISPIVMLAYGTVIVLAVAEFASGLTGILAGGMSALLTEGKSLQELAPKLPLVIGLLALLVAVPIQLLGGYVVGKWIGARCARNGLIVMLGSAAAGAVLLRGIDYLISPPEHFKALFGQEKSAGVLLLAAIGPFAVFSIGGLIGYWRGRRRKLSSYLHYLLSVLPNDTRNLIVDLAFEEAQRAGGKPASALESAS